MTEENMTPTSQTTSSQQDLSSVRTLSGKTIEDFSIPQNLIENEQELVILIMRSEAMNDDEKQYWFTLTEVMNKDQIEKLYDILRRERKKLDEIEKKYGKKEDIDPIEAQKKAEAQAQKRQEAQEQIKTQEETAEEQEKAHEEEILNQLNQV